LTHPHIVYLGFQGRRKPGTSGDDIDETAGTAGTAGAGTAAMAGACKVVPTIGKPWENHRETIGKPEENCDVTQKNEDFMGIIADLC
jgi:hypothetical protein